MASNYLRWYLRQTILVLNDGEFLAHTDFSWTKGKTPSGSTSFTALNGGAYSISDNNRTYSYDVSHAEGVTFDYFTVTGTGTVTMDEESVRSSSPDEISYNGRNYKYLYTQTFTRVSSGGKNVASFLQNSAENGGALPFTYNGNWVYIYPIYVRKPIVTFKDADGTILKTEEVDAGWNVKGVATPPTLSPEKGYAASWSGDYENVTADTDVTAKYTRTDYFVTFNVNGATAGTMAEQAFKVGASQALTANAFQKVFSISFKFPDGSTSSMSSAARFLGWSKTSAGSPIWKDKQTVSVSADTTVYASWGRGEAITLPTSASTAAGKVLKWYSSNGFAASSFVGNAGDSYTPTAGVTLYGREEDAETPASNVGDYEYVIGADIDDGHPHGDMDRIIINGEIMPLRTGVSETTGIEKKRILRGEDVVFLMEWARQRIAAIEMFDYQMLVDGEHTRVQDSTDYKALWASSSSDEAVRFSRRVSAAQMGAIAAPAANAVPNPAGMSWPLTDGYFFDESQLSTGKALEGSNVAPIFREVVEAFGAVRMTGLPSFAPGDALDLSKMEAFFGECAAFGGMGYCPCQGESVIDTPAIGFLYNPLLKGLEVPFVSSYYGEIYNRIGAMWGFSRSRGWSSDGSATYSWNLPKTGHEILKVTAPHAVKVVAVLAMHVRGKVTTQYAHVFIPKELERGSDGVFTLWSDGLSEDSFLDEVEDLADGVGLTTRWTDSEGRACESVGITHLAIVPVVFFDDHTRIG